MFANCSVNQRFDSLMLHVKLLDWMVVLNPFGPILPACEKEHLWLFRLKDPELILLDEPFSALDPSGIDEIAGLLMELSATQVLVSHQVERAAQLCDRCILLESGLIRWEGPATKAWDAWRKSQQDAS